MTEIGILKGVDESTKSTNLTKLIWCGSKERLRQSMLLFCELGLLLPSGEVLVLPGGVVRGRRGGRAHRGGGGRWVSLAGLKSEKYRCKRVVLRMI